MTWSNILYDFTVVFFFWSEFGIKLNHYISLFQISVKTHNNVIVYTDVFGIDITQDTSSLNLGEVRVTSGL